MQKLCKSNNDNNSAYRKLPENQNLETIYKFHEISKTLIPHQAALNLLNDNKTEDEITFYYYNTKLLSFCENDQIGTTSGEIGIPINL